MQIVSIKLVGPHIDQDSSLECVKKIYFFKIPTKTYVVGTQKNRLNETVLLSAQNIC